MSTKIHVFLRKLEIADLWESIFGRVVGSQITECSRQKDSSLKVHALISRTCEDITLAKKDAADVIKVGILR